jgi:hypothetical protein
MSRLRPFLALLLLIALVPAAGAQLASALKPHQTVCQSADFPGA